MSVDAVFSLTHMKTFLILLIHFHVNHNNGFQIMHCRLYQQTYQMEAVI